MVEDPLVYMKQRELEARHQVFDNPLKMKQIQAEIEALKKHKRHHKKDKKKHSKKHRHRSSSSSSSESEDRHKRRRRCSSSSSNERRRASREKRKRRSASRDRRRSHSREERRRSRERRRHSSSSDHRDKRSDLGPDMALYVAKKRQQEEQEALRKRQVAPSVLTPEERQRKLQEMQATAAVYAEDRSRRLASPVREKPVSSGSTSFLKDLNKQVYLESDMKLEERLNRKAHYRARE